MNFKQLSHCYKTNTLQNGHKYKPFRQLVQISNVKKISHLCPMDRYAAAFHTAEPCHLTLGKLVNCNGKPFAHLVKSKFSEDILRNKSIFQTIAQKHFFRHSTVQQSLYFLHHAFPEPGIQTGVNPLIANLPAHKSPYKIRMTRKPICLHSLPLSA